MHLSLLHHTTCLQLFLVPNHSISRHHTYTYINDLYDTLIQYGNRLFKRLELLRRPLYPVYANSTYSRSRSMFYTRSLSCVRRPGATRSASAHRLRRLRRPGPTRTRTPSASHRRRFGWPRIPNAPSTSTCSNSSATRRRCTSPPPTPPRAPPARRLRLRLRVRV